MCASNGSRSLPRSICIWTIKRRSMCSSSIETVDEQKGFVGIETKLTEPFTKESYDNPKYQEWKGKENPWKAEEAYDEIFKPERNQLARNHLLAWALLHQPHPEYAEGRLVVIYHPKDESCDSTIERYRALLRDEDEVKSSFSSVHLGEIVSKWKPWAGEASRLSKWLSDFEERYLALEKSEGADFELEVARRASKGEEANNQDIGSRITEDYLRSIDRQQWFEIRLLNDEASAQLEKAHEQLEAQKALLDEYFEEKRGKLTSGDDLAPGVLKMVKVYLAVKRRVQPGDKVAGRHGNKGVISMIVPVEDMPYMNDGTPVDIVLNPLGVPSRMNVGQVLEAHLGWAAKELGHKVARMLESIERVSKLSKLRRFLQKVYAIKGKEDPVAGLNDSELLELADNLRGGVPMATPVFDGASESEVKDLLALAGLPRDGQTQLFDGRTGESFDSARDGRLHVHDEAQPPCRRQDACAVDGAVQPGHAATVGRKGAVRWPAFRGDGSVGPGSLRGGIYASGDVDREIGRRERPNEDVQEYRRRRTSNGSGYAGILQRIDEGDSIARN